MLAYVFWHTAPAGASGSEAARAHFHAALGADAPAGFSASAAYRVTAPWWDGYEDWYLVDDWPALGALNAAAPAVPGHREVAALSGRGAGGVYALLHGDPGLDAVTAAWTGKPRGEDHAAFQAALPRRGAWQRQMVLGPAPEYCLPHEPGIERRRVA